MDIILRERYWSPQRFNRYLIAVDNDKLRARKLYWANIRLAQAFHPLLSQFEVVLRNAINSTLSVYFSDTEWIIKQKNGFMNDSSLATSRYFLKTSVVKTEKTLARKKIQITYGKVIADQSFGFWVALFLPHHYALLSGSIIRVFPHKPKTETRASIYHRLDVLKKFRNRVNHCEPICFSGNKVDSVVPLQILQMIYELLSWMDPKLCSFFRKLDNIESKVLQIERI